VPDGLRRAPGSGVELGVECADYRHLRPSHKITTWPAIEARLPAPVAGFLFLLNKTVADKGNHLYL
jgi:hypothetical protein